MIVDAKFPLKLTAKSYDNYLEQGYFRGASSLYRTELLSIGKKLSGVVNIRLPLSDFEFTKSQRKLIRTTESKYRVTISKYTHCLDKEHLYQLFKHKFKGFLYPTLNDFLYFDKSKVNIFNTQMVEIFDGKKLISFSLFDRTDNSIANLLAVYSYEYLKDSLGTYSLLKEIHFGLENNLKHAYPGYILSNNTEFNYKLRMGKMEYLDWLTGWSFDPTNEQSNNLVDLINNQINVLSNALNVLNINHQVIYYPNFSLGYILPIPFLVKEPIYVRLLKHEYEDQILFYDHKRNKYNLGLIGTLETFANHNQIDLSEEYKTFDDIDVDIKTCEILSSTKPKPQNIINKLLSMNSTS